MFPVPDNPRLIRHGGAYFLPCFFRCSPGPATCRLREIAYFYVDFAQCKTHYIRLLYFVVKINGIVYTDSLFKDGESGIITIALAGAILA